MSAAGDLFERLARWLERRGLPRKPEWTELELGRKAEDLAPGALRFIRDYYLPCAYGKGAKLSENEARGIVDSICGPEPARTSDRQDDHDSSAEHGRHCARCKRSLAGGDA